MNHETNPLPAAVASPQPCDTPDIRDEMREALMPICKTDAAYNAYIDEVKSKAALSVLSEVEEIKAEFALGGIDLSDSQAQLVSWLLLRQAIKHKRKYAEMAHKEGCDAVARKIRHTRARRRYAGEYPQRKGRSGSQ